MSGRVGEDPEAVLVLCGKPTGAEREHRSLSRIDVVHANVQVLLLRMRWIRPPRRHPG